MQIQIQQLLYHILDPGASEPRLADRPAELDADLTGYFTACIAKAAQSDDAKLCRFLPDSAFAQELRRSTDPIDLSRRIAGVIFEQMVQWPGIPAGDVAVAECTVDGVPYCAVLKLNYRPGYTHRTAELGNGRMNTLAPHLALLPATPRADEAALIDRAGGTIRLLEKRYPLDGARDLYLSTRVFGCAPAMAEKAKLEAVCATAAAAVREAYPEPEQLDDLPPFDGGEVTAVGLLVRGQAVDGAVAVRDVRARLEEQYPLAAPVFDAALEEAGVDAADRVTVSPARIKRLEQRRFKTQSGIEVRIPAELCSSDEAVEFIHSATGGLSLLIKDVLV